MTFITDYLERWAATQPDQRLFGFIDADGGERDGYTYRTFLESSRRIASYLRRERGFKRGDTVLLAYPPGLDIITAFFACARLGVIPVPVAPPGATSFETALAKLSLIAADCDARAVLTNRTLLRLAGNHQSYARPARLPEWIATDTIDGADDEEPADPHPILFLQYTSGSTGDPRGVIVSHDNVIQNALATIDHVPIGVSWLPQYHDMGLIGYYLFPIVWGGTSFGLSPLDFLKTPALWLQTISRVRATYASSPNFGFEYCLRPGKIGPEDLRGVDLRCLRVLMNAAEPVRADTRERFIERFAPLGLNPDACVAAYGLAENTLAATHYGRRTLSLDKSHFQHHRVHIADADASPDTQVRVVSCGKPLRGVHLRIVNGQVRQPLGEREIGEIWLAGSSASEGYWRRESMTREVFGHRLASGASEEQAFLRTGDLGFVHEGELFVCGRSKDLIIVRGVNHYPQDIETAVESVGPTVRTRGVAAFNGEDETLVVVVEVSKRRELPDPAEIACAIQTRCLVTPDTVVLAPAHTISRTTSGKLARRLTREQFIAGTMPCLLIYHPPSMRLPNRRDTPEGLRDRFRNVFARCDPADAQTTTLADLGLDSLMLTELLLEFELVLQERGGERLAGDIDITLLQRLSVAQFSSLLDRLGEGGTGAISAIRADLQRTRSAFETDINQRMRSDAQLQALDIGTVELPEEPVSNVLLTGATGFFGPFLLCSLLRQTPYIYHLLVRAANRDHAMERVREALRRAALLSPGLEAELESRVHFLCGDIARPNLGMRPSEWECLTRQIHAVVHNAAAVNYVANYEALKPHNVDGTRTMLRFAHTARRKQFHFISSTFIFGWTARGLLLEKDNNDEMSNLDFGYAQTKWVAEQLVLGAQARGLDARIYRPSLVSTSTHGAGDRNDVAVRLLAFMINHGIAVDTANQLSILPADVAADNIASIVGQCDLEAKTFHVTVDGYYNMVDLTRLLTREHGYAFTYYDIPGFIGEMNRRCTKADPLYPLLDFFNGSASKIAAMQLKRYRNDRYHEAWKRSGSGRADPTLADTVSYLVAYLREQGLIRQPSNAADGSLAMVQVTSEP